MPVAKPVYFWEADCQLEIKHIAFSLQTEDAKRGNLKVRIFHGDWIKDGQVMWNPAARLKGWLKAQAGVLRPSYVEQVAGGIKVYPADGVYDFIPIAKLNELAGSDTPPAPDGEYELPEGCPFPNKRFIIVKAERGGSRSTTTYWVTLPKSVDVKLKIVSFARSLSPESVKELMEKLGSKVGLGDKYSSGQYGLFELKSFEVKQERLNI
jgi:hypothetical protein